MLSSSHRLQLRRTLPFYTYPYKAHTACFSVYWNRVETQKGAQLAVVVPKKVAKLATKRNRIKRVVRALFSTLLPSLPENVQLVVVVRRPELESQLDYLKQVITEKIR